MLRKSLCVFLLAGCLSCIALALFSGQVFADGTEELGPPIFVPPDGLQMPPGATIIGAGTGLKEQPGKITLILTDSATVHQVLLYWEGQMYENELGDNTIRINGTTIVTGTSIGGPPLFFFKDRQGSAYSSAFRADITTLNHELGLIKPGDNELTVDQVTFSRIANGAGIIVIYTDNDNLHSQNSQIDLVDGIDLAYAGFSKKRQSTVAQTFEFTKTTTNRQGQLVLFVSSVQPVRSMEVITRPSSFEVTVGDVTTVFSNTLASHNGPEWDTVNLKVDIPAQAEQLTVQVFSRDDDHSGKQPASLTWLVAGFAVAEPHPRLGIVKRTNGVAVEASDSSDVPRIQANAMVTWTYKVANLGNVPFTADQIAVSDSDLGQVTTIISKSNGTNATLAPGVTWTYLITGPAVDLQNNPAGITTVLGCPSGATNVLRPTYVNTGTVTAGAATAFDTSYYCNPIAREITLRQLVNSEDGENQPGPFILSGGSITWTYIVENVGNTPLTDVVVTYGDNQEHIICQDPELLPQASLTCIVNSTAIAGQQNRLARVCGTVAGEAICATDRTYYFGANPGLAFQKSTNGQDADSPPGPEIVVGESVNWRYAITNTGNVTLSLLVGDSDPSLTLTCSSSPSPPPRLAPQGTMICTANGIAKAGPYQNIGRVMATSPLGPSLVVTDASHYIGVTRTVAVDLELLVNGLDADAPPGPKVKVNSPLVWSYHVTNRGERPLDQIAVSAVVDQGQPQAVTCPATTLPPQATMVCPVNNTPAIANQHGVTGTVTARGVDGGIPTMVSDSDPAYYFGVNAAITIAKLLNGVRVDQSPGPSIVAGKPITWTYRVTNLGNDLLQAVNVTDSDPGLDPKCQQAALPAGSSMTCTVVGVSIAAAYAHTATVSAISSGSDALLATAPSYYIGVPPLLTLTLTPRSAIVSLGMTHSVTATVTSAGLPVPNLPLTFTVEGANPWPAVQYMTDSNGQVRLSYPGEIGGTDTIRAVIDGGEQPIVSTATVEWLPNWKIDLNPPYPARIVGTPGIIDVKVTDHHDQPVRGAAVSYQIYGVNKTNVPTDVLPTDDSGMTQIRYDYAADLNRSDLDTITVWVDATNITFQAQTTIAWIPVSMTLAVPSLSKQVSVTLTTREETTQTALLTTTVREENLVSNTLIITKLLITLEATPRGQSHIYSDGTTQFTSTIFYEPLPSPNRIRPGCEIQFPDPVLNPTQYQEAITWTVQIWLDLNQDKEATNEEPSCFFEEPTATTVPSLSGIAQDGAVHLAWQTGIEMNLVGFYLLRATDSAGPYQQLNQEIILAEGNAIGASYFYTDRPTEPGVYFYQIETLFSSGDTQSTGPIVILYPDQSVLTNKLYLPYVEK